jgi:hypothetical protein
MHNKWISDINVLQVIKDNVSTNIAEKNLILNLYVLKFNRITSSTNFYFMKVLTQPNTFGIFKQRYCPRGSTRMIHYYYFSSSIQENPPASNIYDEINVQSTNTTISTTQPIINPKPISSTKQPIVYRVNLDQHEDSVIGDQDKTCNQQEQQLHFQQQIQSTDDQHTISIDTNKANEIQERDNTSYICTDSDVRDNITQKHSTNTNSN